MNNQGISFGIVFPYYDMVAIIVWIGLVIFTIRERSWWLFLPVVGGGLNILERWLWGYVRDYWKLPLLPIYNNLNDWLIVIGVGVYLWKKLK